MILTTKGRYAVMAMVELANRPQDSATGLAAIADGQEIPLAYLEQIFARLRRAEMVTSTRGPGGGYKLAKPASEITIAAIIEASEESIKITRCGTAKPEGCMKAKTRCLTHDLWDGLGVHIHHYLNSITLEDVLQRRVNEKMPVMPGAQGFTLESFIVQDHA